MVDKIVRERADDVTHANLEHAVERAMKRKSDDLQDDQEDGGRRKKGKKGSGKSPGKGGRNSSGKGVKATKKGARKR